MSTPEGPTDPNQPSYPSYPTYPSYPSGPGEPGQPGQPGPPPPGSPYGAPPAPPPASAYAHWGQRVGAYLIDSVLILPFYLVGVIVLNVSSRDDGTRNGGLLAIGVAIYLVGLAFLIWNVIFRQGRTGWSIGKKVVGIRLLKEETGQPLGPGMTFVRMLVHILDSLPCYVGYLWPLWDPKRQTFADKIIKTVVIPQAEPGKSATT